MTRRIPLTFTCDGCDSDVVVFCDEAVIVKAPGVLALVTSCPECGAVKVDERLEHVAATYRVVRRVALPAGRAAGAQCDGPLDVAEVEVFAARLACTPDGRTPGHDVVGKPGLHVMLGAVWAELAPEVAR